MRLISDNYGDKLLFRKKGENIVNQSLIVASSGFGKSIAIERAIYNHLKNGFNVICVTDSKDLLEMGFLGMPTSIIADYHKKALQNQNLKQSTAKILIYHPFSFNIVRHKIPEMRIFTFPISAISDSEIRFLLEDSENRIMREIFLQALDDLKETDSLYDFIFKIESLTERKTNSKDQPLPDAERFGLSAVASGNLKHLDEISRIFSLYQTNLFLMQKDFELNLNIEKELFENQDTIKIFTTKYIKDEKTKALVILLLINQIIQHSNKSKFPILLVFDELKDLVPNSRVSFKGILANEISRMFNTSFRNRNISSISSSQSFSGLHRSLLRLNCFSTVYLGFLNSPTDLLDLRQIYGFNNDAINTVQNLTFGEFLIQGIGLPISEQIDMPFKSLVSPFPRKEPNMDFDNLFSRYYPERMKSYSELISKMKTLKEQYIKKNMGIKLSKIKAEEETKIKQQEAKKNVEELQKQVRELTQEKKTSKKEIIEKRNAEIISLYQTGQYSQSDLAKSFNLAQSMINFIVSKTKK